MTAFLVVFIVGLLLFLVGELRNRGRKLRTSRMVAERLQQVIAVRSSSKHAAY